MRLSCDSFYRVAPPFDYFRLIDLEDCSTLSTSSKANIEENSKMYEAVHVKVAAPSPKTDCSLRVVGVHV